MARFRFAAAAVLFLVETGSVQAAAFVGDGSRGGRAYGPD
jgi:hypothetical protein